MYRLQKLLSLIGYCSRRTAERLIKSRKIKINDSIAQVGDKWNKGDIVKINDQIINIPNISQMKLEIIKYYKPLGEVVSRADPHNSVTVFDNLPEVEGKWINIGRLDIQTSGLLLFTNDGDIANKLMHPSSSHTREYLLHTNKEITKIEIDKLLTGVPINNGEIGKFDYISLEGNNFYKIILSTGKNREIRNSLSSINIKTMKLHRSKYSFIELDDMKEGEYRYLNNRERELIF
jgi:23S rRNA pseudouridine2605 synthase